MTARRPPRRWLILSHAFNMDGRAASLTVTDKISHLMDAGIAPVVYSAMTGSQDTRFEHHRLLPWGPSALLFDLRHLLAMHVGRGALYRVVVLLAGVVLALPRLLERAVTGLRSQWSWALPAFVRAAWRLRRGDIELVYSSGGAYSAHLAGWWLKRWCGARWLVEVHDPLVFPDRPLRNRDERLQARLEALICRHADLAWWFTEGALAAARRRHPELGDRGIVVTPGAEPLAAHAPYEPGAVCVFGHFGSLSQTRSLAPFVRALHALLREQPRWRERIRVEVYGSAIDAPARLSILELGLTGQVVPMGRLEHDPASGLSGRERVLQRMQQVDVLLLLHGDTPECAEYIPSKLYDYFWARRPVLALTHLNPELEALVRDHCGRVAPTGDSAAVASVLAELLGQWSTAGLGPVAVPPVGVRQAVDRLIAEVDARGA